MSPTQLEPVKLINLEGKSLEWLEEIVAYAADPICFGKRMKQELTTSLPRNARLHGRRLRMGRQL